MENLRKGLKEWELKFTDLEAALKEATKKVLGLEESLRKIEADAEEKEKRLANEVAMTYNIGFEATLEQVRLLSPLADLSSVDTDVVIDGSLVDDDGASRLRRVCLFYFCYPDCPVSYFDKS